MLCELESSLAQSGIELRFAEMKDPVKDKLRRFELMGQLGEDSFYPTLGAAIDTYLSEHDVDFDP